MEKVKVTKAVANSIEKLREAWGDAADHKMISVAFDDTDSWVSETHAELNEMDSMTLVKALTIGYEVESTPHDSVREAFEAATRSRESAVTDLYKNFQDGIRVGIVRTLRLLDIKIEGVEL